jgi:flagella basal body P-ring formation protein FlgA
MDRPKLENPISKPVPAMFRGLSLSVLLGISLCSQAAESREDFATINDAVGRYVQAQLSSYGDRASIQIGKIDDRLILPSCSKLEVDVPQGNRLVGNTNVRVHCSKGAKWAVNVPITISIQTDYWVASRPLPAGHEVTEGDIEHHAGNLADLPPTAVLDYTQAVGRTLVAGIPAGGALRSDQLRAPYVVKANEFVKVLAHGSGFEVTSEGQALSNANVGEAVRVKMSSGAVVQGIARDGGLVEIRY